MIKTLIILSAFIFSSCVVVEVSDTSVQQVEKPKEVSDRNPAGIGMDVAMPAVKNYHQINNTFSQLTGVSTGDPDVLETFKQIKVQLPTNNDPASINGFNQIAFVRLGFVYCDRYVDGRGSELTDKTPEAAVQDLLDRFVYVDIAGNPADKAFYQELVSIAKNEDGLLPEGSDLNIRSIKLACASLLASAYVTTM